MKSVDPRSFDVFISYKNSDAQGELTQDAKLAFALHDALEEHGIKAFCSTLSLTRMGQSAYKDAINQALDAARIMVVVGTNIDNILSPWVKYEWGSFHDDLLTGRKTTGTLVSYISGMNPNELPRELRSYESFPLEQGGDVRIVEFIQACMENRVELGYAGTATGKRKLAVLKASAGHGLINAQDPDEIEGRDAGDGADAGAGGSAGKGKGSKGKTPFIAAGIAAVLALGLAGGYYAHSQQEAAAQAQAQEQAAQEAAQQAKEQAAQEQAAKEKAEQEALEYEQTHTSYTVKYLVKGTSKGAKGFPKTVKKGDVEVGSTISVKVPSIDGYTLSSVDGAKLNSKKTKASLTVIKKDDGNIIKMYYIKNAEPSTPSYTPSTNSGSTSGGNGGSSGGSTNSGGGSKNSGGSSNKVPKGWIVD